MLNFLKKSFYINFFVVISIFILDRVTKIYVINLKERVDRFEYIKNEFNNYNLNL